MAGTHVMKRIPRIKFPQRHPKPQGAASQPQSPPSSGEVPNYRFKSDVPAPPSNTAIGGKASLLPKRTPVSEKEIEAILLGGCF
uniref:Uncharacterized protein LOC105040694 isoform X2 n=1 Tax=Elaeis guineensis var. tenera TaxID=51953 RepID=A0A6I9QWP7_ELAGV|nr:uncharacterized protein LOC105040694 isoform X2 [Elaeis guineensis]